MFKVICSKVMYNKLRLKIIKEFRDYVLNEKRDSELAQAIYFNDLKRENEELKIRLKQQDEIINSIRILKEILR